MNSHILFYFDFSSAYSYIAQNQIAELEKRSGKPVLWRPIQLGVIFNNNGHAIPRDDSAKMNYMKADLKRCADELGIDYITPPTFPFNASAAMRVFYFIETTNPKMATTFAQAVFTASYTQNIDTSDPAALVTILNDLGMDYDTIVSSNDFNTAKSTLKEHTQAAINSGVFGAPSFVYNNELFWGTDRMNALIKAVKA